jgi:putative ABC transport system substrate-binding protein
MKRREFITLIGGAAAAWPFTAEAQQSERVRRIGVLMAMPENDPEFQAFLAAFREELQKLGLFRNARPRQRLCCNKRAPSPSFS